jgi:hypothetical protein
MLVTQSGYPFGLDFQLFCLVSHVNVAFAYKLSGDRLNAYDDTAKIASRRWIDEKY